ncbi:unnamed protein product [Parnassius apollo]|uniref:(apollo) hypothetical protein n=1 Tax=Parnassius apollo TaxID=110799 RepID=A0A8S3WDI0_PARAO|nr:unnamed protein product [Parnassius apollo]
MKSGWKILKSEDRNFDLHFWVTTLLSVTKERRKADPNLDSLFISTRGLVKAALRSVIASWVKTAFIEAGILSSPGSIRSAVASFRYANNISLEEILRKGNWKRNNNFFKYYCKTVSKQGLAAMLTEVVLTKGRGAFRAADVLPAARFCETDTAALLVTRTG